MAHRRNTDRACRRGRLLAWRYRLDFDWLAVEAGRQCGIAEVCRPRTSIVRAHGAQQTRAHEQGVAGPSMGWQQRRGQQLAGIHRGIVGQSCGSRGVAPFEAVADMTLAAEQQFVAARNSQPPRPDVSVECGNGDGSRPARRDNCPDGKADSAGGQQQCQRDLTPTGARPVEQGCLRRSCGQPVRRHHRRLRPGRLWHWLMVRRRVLHDSELTPLRLTRATPPKAARQLRTDCRAALSSPQSRLCRTTPQTAASTRQWHCWPYARRWARAGCQCGRTATKKSYRAGTRAACRRSNR